MLKLFIKQILSLLLIIGLVGCANSNLQKTESETKTNNNSQNLSINYFVDSQKSGYYILLSNDGSDWKIEKISDRGIIRNNEKQEVLFIDDSLKVAGPSFETLAPHPNGSTFECTIIYSKKAYNPCNSDLMTANIGLSIAKNIVAGALTLGLGSGSHKVLDIDKIRKIIDETNLMSKINEAKIVQAKLDDYHRQLKVTPNILDNSGFYKNEKLFDLKVTREHQLYPILDLNSIKYNINIDPSYYRDYQVKISPNNYTLLYNEQTLLNPQIEIFTKNFRNLYQKNFLVANNDIKLNFEGKDNITFTNLSKDYISIKSISLYFNEKVTNLKLNQAIELAPNMNYPYSMNIIQEISRNYELTKEKAKNSNVEFGFAIKYTNKLNNENTLYKTRTYSLLELTEM